MARINNERLPQYIPCPVNNDGCKHRGSSEGCQDDTEHHKYPRRLVKALAADPECSPEEVTLAKRFINLPFNKVVCCRFIHDYLDMVAYTELPPAEEMQERVDGFYHNPQ
jgi:hypothetical protein